ncbi:MAG TPA: PASTA domain-containing protein, partial [Flavisolibacter sp.]|nr:PASTA domain-containing protein [Flavisolibacter sp.]
DSLPPGIVVKQVPEADQVVKVNRTVYVVINRFVPPDIAMPNLIGYSLRNAEMTLRNMGLRLGDTSSRPDFAKNSVLEQLYNGSQIKPGDKIKVGSKIDLVLASGLGNEDMKVPDLIGKSFAEAKATLDAYGLTLGVPIPDPDVRDTSNAFVYWQSPQPKTEDGVQIRIRPGQMIDLRLSVKPPVRDTTQALPPSDQE